MSYERPQFTEMPLTMLEMKEQRKSICPNNRKWSEDSIKEYYEFYTVRTPAYRPK